MASNHIAQHKYHYKNESFDKMLVQLLSEITPEQMGKLPTDLAHKIFRSKTNPTISQLTDSQKDYILSTAFGKRVIKYIQDDEHGISPEQMKAMQHAWIKKKGSGVNVVALAEELAVHGEFVMSDRDLYEAMQYAALICYMPFYKRAINTRKAAGKFRHPSRDFKIGVENIINMFKQYESIKKRIVTDYGLENMSEWYCLLYFYSGEKKSSTVYTEMFRYSFSCSVAGLKKAIGTLKKKGLLSGRGGPKLHMVDSTVKGKELVDQVMVKYVLNY